jgi:activator of 2-hydroxyglutaryl-CoA dehydratase
MPALDDNACVVYRFYAANEGNPLKKAAEWFALLYEEAASKNASIRLLSAAATEYGEELIQTAFNLDFGIVEIATHIAGAQHIDADISFILDIGGQDIKAIFVKNETIANIALNEACLSGCGSFL